MSVVEESVFAKKAHVLKISNNFWKMTIRTFLAKKVFVNDFIFIDRWSFLHLGLFFIIGLIYPNQWMLIILGSIFFEIIENIVSGHVRFLKENTKDTMSDFAFNFLGYWLGMQFIGIIPTASLCAGGLC